MSSGEFDPHTELGELGDWNLDIEPELVAHQPKSYQKLASAVLEHNRHCKAEDCLCKGFTKIIANPLPGVHYVKGSMPPGDRCLWSFREWCNGYKHKLAVKYRRAERLQSAPGRFLKRDKTTISKLQDACCYFCFVELHKQDQVQCGDPISGRTHWDHLQPISKDGTNYPSNMALTCARCNSEKSDMTEREYWSLLERSDQTGKVRQRQKIRQAQLKKKRQLDKRT